MTLISPTHVQHVQRTRAQAAVRVFILRVARFWKMYAIPAGSKDTLPVLVDHGCDSYHIDVPSGLTEANCAAVEARSRIWEAMIFATVQCYDETLLAVAATYSVMQRATTSAEEDMPQHFMLPPSVSESLTPYFISGMVDEACHAQHVAELTEATSYANARAHLQARYADALVRTAAVIQVEKTILTKHDTAEVDRAFLAECKALWLLEG